MATEYLPAVSANLHYGNDGLLYGSELHTDDLTGTDPEQPYESVSEDIPVVVWVTIGMENRVLAGYSEDTVVIADSISGLMEYNRNQFERVLESRGNQGVILR